MDQDSNNNEHNNEPSSSSSSSSSRSRSPNLAQRFSRQLSRGILPALRNLIRSRNSGQQQAQDPSPSSNANELVDASYPVTLSSPEPSRSPFQRRARVSPESLPSSSHDASPPVLSSQSEPQPACTTSSSPPTTLPAPLSTGVPLLPSPLSPPPSVPLLNANRDDDDANERAFSALNDFLNNANIPEMPAMDSNTTSTTTTSPSPPPSNNPRQRYRLVVYFEERTAEEQPAARYVAVIVGRLDELQFLLSSSNSERGFGDVLNHLFNAYTPKGTPPASNDSIDHLPTVTITEPEQPCMICLEHFVVGTEAVVLPCSHRFHGDECVKTWLKMHNSCPICRYELPVDDAEYESNRKERMLARGFHENSDTSSPMATDEAQQADHNHAHDNEDQFFANPDNMVD